MLRFLVFFLFVQLFSGLKAQDTLRAMHYNLLNYGNITTYCTSTNNSITNKDAFLKTIVQHVKPEIFTVNEMGASITYANRILANCLNVNGTNWYQSANYSNNSFSDLVNMLFYDARVLGLSSQLKISQNLGGGNMARVIDIYRLYYKSASLASGDTIFLNVVVAHLKAGSTTADKTQRAEETEALMAHLNSLPEGENYMIAGDFNVGTGSEQAFQNLVANSDLRFRFYDPINMIGTWNSNSSYAAIHTQSTQTSGGCASSGGMDDRFDFILANTYMMNDSLQVKYIPGSYEALGQDGLRYNQTISTPTNNSEPTAVINALYGMSDHLPVLADFRVNATPVGITSHNPDLPEIFFNNPVSEQLTVTVSGLKGEDATVSLFDLSGREVFSQRLNRTGNQRFNGTFHLQISPGVYLLGVKGEKGFHNKILIKN